MANTYDNPGDLWGKKTITTTPIQASQVAGISDNNFAPVKKKKKTTSVQDQINAALEANKKAQEQQKAIDTQKYIADSTGLLNQLTEAQKASRTNALKDAYNKSLTGLDTQANTAKTNVENTVSTLRQKLNEIRPQYQQNRNQLSAQTAQQEQALRERAAADGNLFGGKYIKNSVGLQSGLQRGINDQNLAESNTVADYANQENVLNSNLATILNNIAANKQQLTEGYGNNEQAIIKEVEAAKLAELMNLQKQGMDYNIQNNQISSNNSQQAFTNAMAAIQAASNVDQQAITNAINQAQVTGYYNPYANAGTPTINYDPNNIQAKIDELKAVNPNDPNIAALENVRFEKVKSSKELLDKYGEQYKTPQQKQIDAEQKYKETQQAQQAELFKLQLEATQLENNINKLKADPNSEMNKLALQQEQAKLVYAQRQIDEVNSRIAENNAQTNKIINTPIASSKTDKTKEYNAILNQVAKMKGETSTTKFNDGSSTTNRKYNDNDLISYIVNSGLDDNEIVRMLNQLNISDQGGTSASSNMDWVTKGKLLGKW